MVIKKMAEKGFNGKLKKYHTMFFENKVDHLVEFFCVDILISLNDEGTGNVGRQHVNNLYLT